MSYGKLSITVHEARFLPAGQHRAFLSLKIGSIQQLTSTSSGGSSPQWETTFAADLKGTEQSIDIRINAEGLLEALASASISLLDLLQKPVTGKTWYPMQTSPPGGEVCLSFEFEGNNSSLASLSNGRPATNKVDAPPAYDSNEPEFSSMSAEESKMKITGSTNYGPALSDSKEFCDIPTNIQRLHIYNDGKNIYGIQVFSRTGAERPRHQKVQDPFGFSVLELKVGEYITEVKGGEDDAGIVFLQLFTNMGTKKHYGGKTDGYVCPFSVYIPYGNIVVGFKGAYGGKMHNVGVISASGYC